jgi:phosphocarrier protein
MELHSMAENQCCTRIKVPGKLGVHGRVAGRLVQEAQKCAATVTIRHADREADAKSILDILMLAAGQGSTIELNAVGSDAETALQRLVDCLHHE